MKATDFGIAEALTILCSAGVVSRRLFRLMEKGSVALEGARPQQSAPRVSFAGPRQIGVAPTTAGGADGHHQWWN